MTAAVTRVAEEGEPHGAETSLPAVRVEPLAIADPLATIPGLESELMHRWLVWDAWTAGRRRVDLHPLVLDVSVHRAAVATAEGAWSLVTAAAERAAADPVEGARYRLHPDVARLASASRAAGDRGAIARVDLLLREDGRFTCCEVNADCPGGFNEAMALPRLAKAAGLRRRGLEDPTTIVQVLADRLVAASGGRGSPRGAIALVYATGYAEDLQICALVERLVEERGGRTERVSPTMLKAAPDGSHHLVVRGQRVAVLYRFYPIEYMAGQTNLEAIAAATENGALVSLSSFAQIHAQSKLAMARAFAHDADSASAFFPETSAFEDVPRDRLAREREGWVIKRDLSRVGDHVFVGSLLSPEDFGEVLDDVASVEQDRAGAGMHQAWIAQRFVPQRALPTPWGPRLLTLGVYLTDGRFAGYFARLSATSHCSHDALVLPTFVDRPLEVCA